VRNINRIKKLTNLLSENGHKEHLNRIQDGYKQIDATRLEYTD